MFRKDLLTAPQIVSTIENRGALLHSQEEWNGRCRGPFSFQRQTSERQESTGIIYVLLGCMFQGWASMRIHTTILKFFPGLSLSTITHELTSFIPACFHWSAVHIGYCGLTAWACKGNQFSYIGRQVWDACILSLSALSYLGFTTWLITPIMLWPWTCWLTKLFGVSCFYFLQLLVRTKDIVSIPSIMDPLSITASIITIVGVGGQAAKAVRKLASLKGASDLVLALNNELSDLHLVVLTIQAIFLRQQNSDIPFPGYRASEANLDISVINALTQANDKALELDTLYKRLSKTALSSNKSTALRRSLGYENTRKWDRCRKIFVV